MNFSLLKNFTHNFAKISIISCKSVPSISQSHNHRYLSHFVNEVKFSFFEESSGNTVEVSGALDKTVLDIALDNNIDIEGACGGELACSTCHVVVEKDLFDKLPAKKEEEDDMLDLAWGLTDTSRLCCQLKVTKELEGAVFKVPAETNNML